MPYLVTPEDAITEYVTQNTKGSVTTVTENLPSAAEQIGIVGPQVDTAIVFVTSNSGEGVATFDGNYGDRNNLTLWLEGDELIKAVTSVCTHTIVVMHTVGPVIVSDWYDNENVTAILWAGLPGQESGNSLVDVLWGAHNPGGKLPFTFGKTRESYGRSVLYEPNNGDAAPQQSMTTVDIDYRHFDANNIEPIYEFGFGLSYTTFEYSDLKVTPVDAAPYQPGSGMTQPARKIGGNTTLGDYVSNLSYTITPLTLMNSQSDYVFPPKSKIPAYESYIYPYLTSSDPKEASNDAHYGEPSSSWLPAGATDSSAQPILPAGGGIGGNPGLWESVTKVSATIKNTGEVAGHEVPQLYVALGNDEPPKVLRGFDRIYIEPGESQTFEAQLMRRDLSTWDTESQNWVMVDEATIYVGCSSRKLPLSQKVDLRA